MLRQLSSAAAALLLALPAAAQQSTAPAPAPRPPQLPVAAASTRASVEVLLSHRMIGGQWLAAAPIAGPARIRIEYGQPHLRGRTLGAPGLVPMDSVWRLGANLATELHTDVDLTIGDKFIPRGIYTLFALPGRNGWKLIVNRQLLEWGTDYDPAQDIARIDLRSRTLSEPMESLSIYLIPESLPPAPAGAPSTSPQLPRGTMKIVWGTSELSTPWRVGR